MVASMQSARLNDVAAQQDASEDMHRRLVWLMVSRRTHRALVRHLQQWQAWTGRRLVQMHVMLAVVSRLGHLKQSKCFELWWQHRCRDVMLRECVLGWQHRRVGSAMRQWHNHVKCSRLAMQELVASA